MAASGQIVVAAENVTDAGLFDVLMDIPTHERYQTRPFFPVSHWQFEGLTWADPRIFWPNVAALVAVYAWIFRSRARTS